MATAQRIITGFIPRMGNLLHDHLIEWFGIAGNEVKVFGTVGNDGIYLESDVLTQQQLDDALNGVNALTVTSDKATITADDANTATISCADGAISGDVDVLINVWLNGEIYAANVVDTLVGGVSTSTLSTSLPGTYLIEVKRNTGTDYETGYVEIEAI